MLFSVYVQVIFHSSEVYFLLRRFGWLIAISTPNGQVVVVKKAITLSLPFRLPYQYA